MKLGSHEVKRFTHLAQQFSSLLVNFKPQLVLIEQNFVFRNVRSTATLNQLQGAIRLICAEHAIPIEMIDNNTSKKHVLGSTVYWDGQSYVGVTKEMMEAGVRRATCDDSLMPATADFDACDAIAIGLAYYNAPITKLALARRPDRLKATKKVKQAA